MLKVKCAYYLKLTLVTALATIFFSSVEAAPEQPLLFLALAFVLIVCIRLLWLSALQDEKAIKKRKLQIRQKDAPHHIRRTNRAA